MFERLKESTALELSVCGKEKWKCGNNEIKKKKYVQICFNTK